MVRKAVRIENTTKDLNKYFGDFGQAIMEESPMACALVATSVVENTLMTLLITFFKPGSTTEGLFKSPGGLLGDLFKCTQIAYGIGLIPKPVKTNLGIVADVRNAFAHSTQILSFKSPEILSLCNKLSLPKGVDVTTYTPTDRFNPQRLRFTVVCASLCQHLIAYAPLYARPLAECRENLKTTVEW